MKKNAKKPTIGKARTGGYKSIQHYAFRQPRDMPLFSFRWIREMLYDSTIRLGLAMRNAPLLSAEFAYQEKGSEEWTTGVQANNPVIGAFVERQFKRIWQHHLTGLLQSQVCGWVAGEVVLKKSSAQVIEVDSILTRRAEDTLPLTRCGELAGVRFLHVEDVIEGHVDIEFPNCIWHRFRPEPGTFHSESVLLGAFSAWCDKWLDGGALDVRRLFMHKDAYGGCVLEYPEGITPVDMGNGTIKEIPNRDIAREIVEQIKAGGVVTLPSDIDPVTKQNRWKFTPAHVAANPAHILLYPKDLDTEMLRGMEIPDDIFTADADTSGAWAGKQVPLMAFYAGEEIWLRQLVRDIDQQVVRPLVTLNYGPGQWYEVTTKPLALQAMESQQSRKPEQPAPQQQQQPTFQPQDALRMSLEAIGRGLPAGPFVNGAKRIRMDASHKGQRAPTGGITLNGKRYEGGEFIPQAEVDSLDKSEKSKLKAAQIISEGRKKAKTSGSSGLTYIGDMDEQGILHAPSMKGRLEEFAKKAGKTIDEMATEHGFSDGDQMANVAEATKALGHATLGHAAKSLGFATVQAFAKYGASDGEHMPTVLRQAFKKKAIAAARLSINPKRQRDCERGKSGGEKTKNTGEGQWRR